LRVLQVNKYYFPKSGSERYLFDVSAMLQNHGHEVIPFAMKHKNELLNFMDKNDVGLDEANMSKLDLAKKVAEYVKEWRIGNF